MLRTPPGVRRGPGSDPAGRASTPSCPSNAASETPPSSERSTRRRAFSSAAGFLRHSCVTSNALALDAMRAISGPSGILHPDQEVFDSCTLTNRTGGTTTDVEPERGEIPETRRTRQRKLKGSSSVAKYGWQGGYGQYWSWTKGFGVQTARSATKNRATGSVRM